MDPVLADAAVAARAVERYLLRKRRGLAQALEISGDRGAVLIRASGEFPQEMIREAEELLEIGAALVTVGVLEVDPAEFTIAVSDIVMPEPDPKREILHSQVRYFPHPTCEWFEISTGSLTLDNRGILYEPEWVIVRDDPGRPSDQHVIPVADVRNCRRGQWWDIPCLMLDTGQFTYRYGWPAARGEFAAIFDVDEWLVHLRSLLREQE